MVEIPKNLDYEDIDFKMNAKILKKSNVPNDEILDLSKYSKIKVPNLLKSNHFKSNKDLKAENKNSFKKFSTFLNNNNENELVISAERRISKKEIYVDSKTKNLSTEKKKKKNLPLYYIELDKKKNKKSKIDIDIFQENLIKVANSFQKESKNYNLR